MIKNIKTLLFLLFALTMNAVINAQEVFFKDNNTKLSQIAPSHFYPMQTENIFREYRNKLPSDNLRLINATEINVADRFGISGEALAMDGIHGYIRTPDAQFYEMIQNKVINMSFWVRYTDDVYSGSKTGTVFSIRDKVNGNPKIRCMIENKKIMMYVQRKNTAGSLVEVPIIEMDIPVSMEGGGELNNYFFFCLTSANTLLGKRTRIYISKPDGSLFSRLYYIYPFENISPTDDMMALWGGWPGNNTPVERVDDLMFFQKHPYASRMLTPEDVLNNFYLQSPLYEGVSYEISGVNADRIEGTWGLESQRNNATNLAEEYITVKSSDANITPFGYSRFNVKKKNGAVRTFSFSNMKMGGSFYPSTNGYIYMGHGRGEQYYHYIRESPESRYTVSPNMFHLVRDTDNKYLQTYQGSGNDWLVVDNHPSDRRRMVFGINAAMKVFRGPERNYSGTVKLINHSERVATGSAAGYDRYVAWSYIALNKPFQNFIVSNTGLGNYIKHYFKSTEEAMYLRRYYGKADLADGNSMITQATRDCMWEFLFYKYDTNGKPLYIMRTADDNVAFKMGIINGEYNVSQRYKDVLLTNGEVPDRFLWSIRKSN